MCEKPHMSLYFNLKTRFDMNCKAAAVMAAAAEAEVAAAAVAAAATIAAAMVNLWQVWPEFLIILVI